jgi:anti-anti-sigma factor
VKDLAQLVVGSDDDVIAVTLSGEIDMSNAADIEAAVERAVPNTACGMVLDLSELTYLDSAGIRMLIGLANRFRWRRQQLYVAVPEGSRVRRVLDLAGATGAFTIDPTVEAARARMDRSRTDKR